MPRLPARRAGRGRSSGRRRRRRRRGPPRSRRTVVVVLPATTCAFVTACCGPTKKPLPTDSRAPHPALVIRVVLAIADSARPATCESAGRSTGAAGGGSSPAKSPGRSVVASSSMIRPATAPGGGSRSPVIRIATESRAAGPKNGEKLVASRPPISHTSRTTCAAPTMAPPAMSSGRNGLERIPRLSVAPIAAPEASPARTRAPTPSSVIRARVGCSTCASGS